VKRCLYLAMILGLLASLLIVAMPASPASAVEPPPTPPSSSPYEVKVDSIPVYPSSTGQITDVWVKNIATQGLSGYSITLTWDNTNVHVTSVLAPNNGFGGSFVLGPIKPFGTTRTVAFNSLWSGPPSTATDLVVAQLVFNPVTSGAPITPTSATLSDNNGALVTYGALTAGTVTIVTTGPTVDTSMVAALAPDGTGVAGLTVGLVPPALGWGTAGSVAPSSYLVLQLTGGSSDVQVVGLTGVASWSATPAAPSAGVFPFSGSTTPGAAGDVAFLPIKLNGTAVTTETLSTAWGTGAAVVAAYGPLPGSVTGFVDGVHTSVALQRGDIDRDGSVTIADAAIGRLYVVGLAPITAINPVNMACISHDGASGDTITISDVLFLRQYLAGIRGNDFDLLP